MAALATINIGMSLGAHHGVHPFFEKNKRLAKSPNTSHEAPSSSQQPVSSGDDEKLSGTLTNVKLLPNEPPQTETPIDPLTRSDNDPTETSSSSTTRQAGHGLASGNSHNLVSGKPKVEQVIQAEQSVQVNGAEVASLDIDLNSARNKRRRLSAPEELDLTEDSSTAWLVQLHEAAYGQSGPTTSAQSNLTDGSQIGETETPYLPLKAQDLDPCRTEEQGILPEVSTPEAGSLEMPSTQRSPPRTKMLTFRADGRLASPKSRKRVGGNPKDAKSNGSLKLPVNHEVVVIKYGSDEETRNHIGQKIYAILGQGVKGQGSVAEAPVESSQLAKTAPSGPPKPTHPFFLGNAAVKQAGGVKALVESKRTSTSTAGSDSEHDSHTIPSKSRPSIENQHHTHTSPGSADPKPSFLSRGLTGALRNPAGVEPAWPSKDAMHIRGFERSRDDASIRHVDRSKTQVKLKGSLVRIPSDEDVVLQLALRLPIGERRGILERSNTPSVLRVPQREVMTGTQLQALSRQEVSTRLHASLHASEADLGHGVETTRNKAHPVVTRLFSEIPTSLTAFDRAQCEPYSWVHKYAPKRAEEVLQPGPEAILLKDWLRNLTIEATDPAGVDGQPVRTSSTSAKRPVRDNGGPQRVKRRKRRKRADLLDGFVVSSDDENNEMDELTGPENGSEDLVRGGGYARKRTVVRTGGMEESLKPSGAASGLSNAILISGPHGCGKTAAVYATAKELGFEVFELNPGSKRSGKDIMDKVGDMARNHLVHHASEGEERHEGVSKGRDNTPHHDNIAHGRPILNSFTKMKGNARTKTLATHGDIKPKSAPGPKPKQQAKPKQSLILLEEVDILFDDDKQFWATVLGLIAQSKRPVIMTCNDESLVPLNQMSLHAILRFTCPASDPAADYLLLLAASEGHLLGRNAVLALCKSKDFDLRASITELEFWCQMAIGDKKGGLEWILERWPADNDPGDPDQRLRVVSKDTYLKGMGWFNRDNLFGFDRPSSERKVELLLEAWRNWGIGTEDWVRGEDTNVRSVADTVARDGPGKASFRALIDCERLADAASATDLFGSPGLRVGYQVFLDPTQPAISEKVRGSFVEGYTFIQSDILVEQGELSTGLVMTTQALARGAPPSLSDPLHDADAMEESLINYIADGHGKDHAIRSLTRMDLAAAFDRLAEPAKRNVNQPAGLLLSEFDRTTSLVVEDLAPYVRSIIAYDLRLEHERLRLSNLLSQGGRDGKRIRTTRASRAALEGGSKAHTRRERWLPVETNAALVLRTGGHGWQDVVAKYSLQGDGDGDGGDGDDAGSNPKVSRRSSLDSTTAGET